MVRYVYAKSSSKGTLVNKIGKYLNQNIDGAFKITFKPMTCEILMKMYYQLEGEPESFSEMVFEISITSYQNKIRVNLTEMTDSEKTIGQVILTDDEVKDLNLAKKRVLSTLKRAISKEYKDYIFIY